MNFAGLKNDGLFQLTNNVNLDRQKHVNQPIVGWLKMLKGNMLLLQPAFLVVFQPQHWAMATKVMYPMYRTPWTWCLCGWKSTIFRFVYLGMSGVSMDWGLNIMKHKHVGMGQYL